MEIKIRPIESLCATVEEIQAQRMFARIGKLLIATAVPTPPNPPKGPSKLNDLSKFYKYLEIFKFKYANKIDGFMPNINKQDLTKLLKYLT